MAHISRFDDLLWPMEKALNDKRIDKSKTKVTSNSTYIIERWNTTESYVSEKDPDERIVTCCQRNVQLDCIVSCCLLKRWCGNVVENCWK